MFIKKIPKPNGRTYLTVVHGYSKDGKTRHKTIQKLGYLDELQKQYEDPIAHFNDVVTAMNEERRVNKHVTIDIDMDEQLERGASNRKNYGHVVLSKIYHELKIDIFLKNARRHENFKFNTDSIMRLLVFSRLLEPCSKLMTVLRKDKYFDNFKFSIDDVYHALTHFDAISVDLQKHLHNQVTDTIGRDTSLVYYDVTNYYFEIDKEDDLRKTGPSKEKKKDPIVQMGLLLDRNGLPVTYKMFPGNTHDSQTLTPTLRDVKKDFGVGRIIVVADKGLNSGDNIAFNMVLGDGYIYSKSVSGASADFKKWVLEESEYRKYSDEYKLKSQVIPNATNMVTLAISPKTGKKFKKPHKVNIPIEQKQIVFYSKKYADRAKYKRDEAIAKAQKFIADPSKYHGRIEYGAAGYVKNVQFDADTGEVVTPKENLSIHWEKVKEEEKYDGFYAILTSELDENDESIIEAYRGLWRIEESFKVTKSVLDARPAYVRTEPHINAHFLVCFIALLIGRIAEKTLGGKYTIENIVETLRKVECSYLQQNIWLFDYADKVTDDMNAAFGTNFGLKQMTTLDIKKFLGSVKRHDD